MPFSSGTILPEEEDWSGLFMSASSGLANALCSFSSSSRFSGISSMDSDSFQISSEENES